MLRYSMDMIEQRVAIDHDPVEPHNRGETDLWLVEGRSFMDDTPKSPAERLGHAARPVTGRF